MGQPLDSSQTSERLSRLATLWSTVFAAQKSPAEEGLSARRALLERYSAAAYRYCLGAVRDPDLAEQLSQDFAVRFLEGAFDRADPERGRFRDYIKTSLINMVRDHFREKQQQPWPLSRGNWEPAVHPGVPEERLSFEDCLREELLERTWAELKRLYPRYHTVLRLRIDRPDMSSRDLAEMLTREWDKQLTPSLIRKTVERARSKFADLLLEEVACSVESDGAGQLRTELKQIDLLKYCGSALERRAGRTSK